ncbi:hypothetical protein REPUB_Repub18cG0021900 [Reevesia pubescens]
MVEANGSVNEDEVTPLVPPGFPSKCNIVEANGSVDEGGATPLIVSGISPKHNILEVKDVVEDKVAETIAISASNNDSMGNKVGRNDEKDAGENSSDCSSNADKEHPRCELITTLGAEKVMPAETASGGSKGASIQDAIERNAERAADKTVGNNGIPDDKAASINDIEGYGNSCLNAISKLHLEARISRLERLAAEIKAEGKLSP